VAVNRCYTAFDLMELDSLLIYSYSRRENLLTALFVFVSGYVC